MKVFGNLKKKLKKKVSALTWKHAVALVLITGSAVLLILHYRLSLSRTGSALRDLWNSIRFWSGMMLSDSGIDAGATFPSVLDPIEGSWRDSVPIDVNLLEYKLQNFGFAMLNRENITGFRAWMGSASTMFLIVLSYLLPVILLFPWVIGWILKRPNNRPAGYDTRLVRLCKKLWERVYMPVFRRFAEFVEFLQGESGKSLASVLLAVWLLNLNVFTILLEGLAYYFYVLGMCAVDPFRIFSYDIVVQLTKLFADALIMLSGAPAVCWVVLALILLDRYRQRIGADLIRHMEAMNTGFVKAQPISVCFVGDPGVGKTTMAVDFALTTENVFRAESLDTLFRHELHFPGFPIQKLEEAFCREIEEGRIKNLPQINLWIDDLQARGECFGYRAVPFSNGNGMVELYATVKTYCRAFFIYITKQYIVSTIPIRTDSVRKNRYDAFPLWDSDFLSRDPRRRAEQSRFSHILDQDIQRLGKKVMQDNRLSGSLGFGCYVEPEWGKSRVNKLELEGIKADDTVANQKNDRYAYARKMARHAEALVDFFPYIRFFADEQRPENVPADLRDFTSIISITGKTETQLALPFFTFTNMLYDLTYKRYKRFYYSVRNVRRDNCLLLWLSKAAMSAFLRYRSRMYNIYGYQVLDLMCESGRNYGNTGAAGITGAAHPWFRLYNKIYSDRFQSDCFVSAFRKAQLDCGLGINDYPSFSGLSMTVEQMEQEHDYFMMNLLEMFRLKEPESEKDVKPVPEEPVQVSEPEAKPALSSDSDFDPFDC